MALVDWLKEREADLNVFDGGRTAATVRRERAKAPPAQTVRKPANTLTNNAVTRGFSRAYDTVNPLDNGRNWNQRTPVNNDSMFKQARDSMKSRLSSAPSPTNPMGVVGMGGRLLQNVSSRIPNNPLPNSNPVTRFANQQIVQPYKQTTGNVGQLFQGRNPYTGNAKQQVGQFGQDVINMASVTPIGGAAKLAAQGGRVLPRVMQGVKSGAKVGAGFGAAQGTADALKQDQNLPQAARTIATSTVIGGVVGGVTGGALPAAGAAARAAAPVVRKGAQRTAQAVQQADQRAFTPRVNVQDQNILRDYSDMVHGAYNPQGAELSNLIATARQVGTKYGVDLATGSVEQRRQAVNAVLDRVGQRGRQVSQGGYAKIPGGDRDPAPDLSPEQKEFINDYAEMLKSMGEGNGVDILPDGTRVSNNFRTTENQGKRMTNADWFNQARKEVEGGRAAYGASEDFKQLPGLKKAPVSRQLSSRQQAIARSSGRKADPISAGQTSPANMPNASRNAQDSSLTNFNTGKYNVSDEARQGIQETVQDLQPELEKKLGRKLSLKEVQQFADNSNKVLGSSRTRQQTLEATAAMQNARERIAELNQKVADGGLLSAAEQQEMVKLTLNVKTKAADLARQLGSLRNTVNPTEKSMIDLMIERISKQVDDMDAVNKAAAKYDLNDPKQLGQFYREFVKATPEDWLDKLRYNSMLSSPITHIRNTTANLTGIAAVNPVRKVFEGGLDATRAALTRGDRTRFAGEVAPYYKGAFKSLPEAAQAFKDVWSNSAIVKNPDFDALRNVPLAQGGVKGFLNDVLDVTTKFMESIDQFGVTIGRGGEKAALNYRQGKGVKVKNLEQKAEDAANYSLFRNDLGNKEQGHVLRAIDAIPMAVSKWRMSDNPVLRNVAKFTFPFVKTPTNVAKQMLEYSPLGVATLPGNADKTAQVAKIAMGTAAVGVAAGVFAANNSLTGSMPTNPTEKAKFLAEGKQPYSFKIGNKWVSYQYLHPGISFNLAAVASVKNALDSKKIDETTAEKVLEGLANSSKFFADQSYFKSAQDFLNNIQGEAFNTTSSTILNTASNMATQVIPFRAMATWINNIVDPYQRATDYTASAGEQFLQNITKQLPILSQDAPVKKDNLGQPLERPDRFINAISPARISTDKTSGDTSQSPLRSEVDRLIRNDENIAIKPIKGREKFDGVETALTPQQTKELNDGITNKVTGAWDELIQTDEYKALNDKDKQNALSSLKSDITAVEKLDFAARNNLGRYSSDPNAKQEKLSDKQAAIQNGNLDVTTYAKSGDTKNNVTLKGDNRGTALLDKVGTMTEDQRKDWETKELDPKYKDMYDRAQQIRFEGLPDLPQNNKVLGLYADLLEKRSKGMSKLAENKAKLTFLKEAYKSELSKEARELLGDTSANDIIDGINQGFITPDDVALAVQFDNLMVEKGLASSADIPKAVREELGLGLAPNMKASSRRGGGRRGGSIGEYDLYGIANPLSTERSLRQLVRQATL